MDWEVVIVQFNVELEILINIILKYIINKQGC